MKTKIALLFLLATIARAADDPETVCRAHLRNLGGAINAYKLVHKKEAPTKLSALYIEAWADSYGDFICPASGTSITLTPDIDTKSDYTLEPLPNAKDILVREKSPHHANGQVLALFADGSIKLIAIADSPAPKVATNTPAPATPPTPPVAPPVVKPPTPPVTQPTAPVVTPPPMPVKPTGAVVLESGDNPAPRPVAPTIKRGANSNPVVLNVPLDRNGKPLALPDEVLKQLQAAMQREADGDGAITIQPSPDSPVLEFSDAPITPRPKSGGYLGAKLRDLGGDTLGAEVFEVITDSPAFAGGLKTKDIITTVNGQGVEDAASVRQILSQNGPGAPIKLVVIRAGRLQKLSITLGERPAPPAPPLGR